MPLAGIMRISAPVLRHEDNTTMTTIDEHNVIEGEE